MADKPVAALCHGPKRLAAAGVLDGDETTSYPAVREECVSVGCSWVDEVTVDGNLVTGQAWPDHPEWLAAFLGVLGTSVEHGTAPATDDD